MVDLAAPGTDWVLTRDNDRLFISMPSLNQVAVVDTVAFRVQANVDAGEKPNRLSIQPDGKYLWIGNDAIEKPATSGITVIDAATLRFMLVIIFFFIRRYVGKKNGCAGMFIVPNSSALA